MLYVPEDSGTEVYVEKNDLRNAFQNWASMNVLSDIKDPKSYMVYLPARIKEALYADYQINTMDQRVRTGGRRIGVLKGVCLKHPDSGEKGLKKITTPTSEIFNFEGKDAYYSVEPFEKTQSDVQSFTALQKKITALRFPEKKYNDQEGK